MKKIALSVLSITASLGIGLGFMGTHVLANTQKNTTSEVMVRLDRSLSATDDLQSQLQQQGYSDLGQVEIVNAEEGIIKIKTSALKKARLPLSAKISTNHLYYPAFKIREIDETELYETQLQNGFLDKMKGQFFSIFDIRPMDSSIPPVALPPSTISVGADPLVKKDYTFKNVNFDPKSLLRSTLTVAVIDTGVDYNHGDLQATMWRNPSNSKEIGWDFAHNNSTPFDIVNFNIQGCIDDPMCSMGIGQEKFMSNPGHGTHCSGRVGAIANNAKGVRAMGAGSKVMGLKMFYDLGDAHPGAGDDAAAIKSIDYAIKNGAKVISASWGGRGPREAQDNAELHAAIRRAQAAGVIMVIAAGNDSIDQDNDPEPSFPAAFTDLDNIIVVAASDSKDKLADFSNYGASSVHIAAPGVKILSTISGGSYSDKVATYKTRDGRVKTIYWDGTSMATPIVAGATSLVWSLHPEESYQQIRQRILSTVRKVPGLTGKVSSGGVLDVMAALK
jgi:subtilisin family serine protease